MENIIREAHTTAQVDVIAVSARKFLTDNLVENGRIIHIIGQIFINNSVQCLGVPPKPGDVIGSYETILVFPLSVPVLQSYNLFVQGLTCVSKRRWAFHFE